MREDWIECTLREVCKIGSSKRILKKEYVSEGIPFYRTKEIKELSLGKELSIELYISNEKYNDIKNRFDIPKKGDVLISAVGTIGITYTIKNNDPFYFKDGNLIWLRDIQGLESTFLNLGLTHFVRNSSILKTSGSAYNALTIEKLNSLPFPLPPLVEQKAIVKKIEELFSSLDSGIADLKKAQYKLVIYRQAVLKKAFEGELTKEWREKQTNLPSADELLEQIKEERQKHYKQQLEDWKKAVKIWEKDGKVGKKPKKPTLLKPELDLSKLVQELNDLPNIWTYINLDYAVYKLGDGLHGTPTYSEVGDYYFINGNNLDNGKINIKPNTKRVDYSEFLKYQKDLNQDTVFVSINGTIGNVSFYDNEKVILGKSACYFNLLTGINKDYIRWRIDSLGFRNYAFKNATGSTIKNVPLSAMRNFAFSLCSKQEQHQVVLEIESRLSVCDKVEKDITDSLEKAQALRQSILKKAFEGKLLSEEEIAACKAHPEYEPASVLLGRIEEEKKK